LDHEPGVDQFGEMLADGVVIEREVPGELRHIHRLVGVGEVAEDAMAGVIA